MASASTDTDSVYVILTNCDSMDCCARDVYKMYDAKSETRPIHQSLETEVRPRHWSDKTEMRHWSEETETLKKTFPDYLVQDNNPVL